MSLRFRLASLASLLSFAACTPIDGNADLAFLEGSVTLNGQSATCADFGADYVEVAILGGDFGSCSYPNGPGNGRVCTPAHFEVPCDAPELSRVFDDRVSSYVVTMSLRKRGLAATLASSAPERLDLGAAGTFPLTIAAASVDVSWRATAPLPDSAFLLYVGEVPREVLTSSSSPLRVFAPIGASTALEARSVTNALLGKATVAPAGATQVELVLTPPAPLQ